jgi:DNA-binding MarR family transcriptional regulator
MASDPKPDDRWENWLVHLLWAVSVRASALGEAALGDSPLTLAGLGVLENVHTRPGTTIAEIARRSPQSQQALSQIAARLEKLGFIERRLSDAGRGIGLHLTAAGERARVHARGSTEAFEAELGAALGPGRHARLVTLLDQMQGALARFEPSGRTAG